MKTNRGHLKGKLLFAAAALLLAATRGRAQTIVYDNLSTAGLGNAYGEPFVNNLILGDSLTLTQGGKLTMFGLTVFNYDAGNGGVIYTGTMYVNFYDNTIPYSGGSLSAENPLLGSATLSFDFTSMGGLQDEAVTTQIFDLTSSNITLPQNILVTQQFVETSGDSSGAGATLLSDPVVGSSPNTVYLNSSATPEGLYTFPGDPGQLGYQIQVSSGGGITNPVANPQNVSLLKNTTAHITLTGSDADGDTLTYHIVASPTNGFLTGTAPNVVYHPNTNYVGPDAFTFLVNDGSTNSAPALVSIVVSAGLIINPIWDSTITNDPNAAAIMNTINGAIQIFEGLYGNSVTVNILFAEMGSGLGQSQTWLSTISYSSFLTALTASAKTTNDAIALAHIPPGPNEPVTGGSSLTLTLPNLRALGFSGQTPPTNYDSIVSFNMSIINITRTNINPSKYDLQAVASHEMDEVLGSGSGLGQPTISPEDLFRYDSSGNRNYTTSGDNAYFSIDGGVTDLVRFNQNASGDYGDFWSISPHSPVRVQDAFGTPGTTPNLTVEKTVLDVLGWYLLGATASVPAPVIQSVTDSGTTVHLTWSSVAGQSYQLQFETNVAGNAWTNLGAAIVATGATTSATDSTATNHQRFYRVGLLPGSLILPAVATAPDDSIIPGPPSIRTRNLYPAPWHSSGSGGAIQPFYSAKAVRIAPSGPLSAP